MCLSSSAMGMYGEWLRVTPAELRQVMADPEASYQLTDTEETDRRSGTDKTWHALAYLLQRADFPVSIITGEQCVVDDPDDSEVDWGYGPPGYLTPQQVSIASSALADLTAERLLDGVSPADLAREQIYPQVWNRPDELAWAVHALPYMRDFFAAAAAQGDAILCWIG